MREAEHGEIEQLLAVLVAEPAQLQPFESRVDVCDREHGPTGNVRLRRRPEGGQVAADEQREPFLAGDVLKPDPVFARRKRSARRLPRFRRRGPDEGQVTRRLQTAALGCEELVGLLARPRTPSGGKPAGRLAATWRCPQAESLPMVSVHHSWRDGSEALRDGQ